MAETVQLEHLTVVNEALQRLDRQAAALNGNIIKSMETLRKLSLDQEAAMQATQAARDETARLRTDIDASWQAHAQRVAESDAKLQARFLDAEQREQRAQESHGASEKAADEARLAMAEHREAVEETGKRLESLLEQMQNLLKPFLPTPVVPKTVMTTDSTPTTVVLTDSTTVSNH